MYTTMVPGDESVGFINISVDKDSYKHYTQNANPTYNIDNQYTKKYYHTGDNKNNVQYDNQFLLYFVAIYDEKGNEVITQAGNKTAASYDANGLPKNGTLYTFSKAQTGLSSDITGHVYTSYDNMVNDIYARTNAIFAEHSDLIEGKYTIYIGVCDKSWNIYSPNKWSIEKSELNIQPRLSFRDISMGDFRQTGYKNEYQLDANGEETNVKIPSSLFLKSNNGTVVQTTANGRTYTFPMYRLPKYTVTQTIAGNKYYMTDYTKTQKDQYGLASGNYVSDTALGYSKNNTYVVKTGYNFSVIVDSIGADYVQLEFYSVEDNKKIEMMVPDISEYTSDSSSVLKRGERRQDGSWEFILAFPEQIDCKGVYGKVYLYKTSLTNGQKELTRSITLGSKETPLIVFDESSLLNDLGVSVTN